MNSALKKLPPCLPLLLVVSVFLVLGHSTRAGAAEYRPKDPLEKKELVETRRLAASRSADDRFKALERLSAFHDLRDCELHWKLMNDPDIKVRVLAIECVSSFGGMSSCLSLGSEEFVLPKEMAQKMTALLEKEVTMERICAVFGGEKIEIYPAAQVLSSAVGLHHLYTRFHAGKVGDADALEWRVLHPLSLVMATRNRDFPDEVIGFQSDVLKTLRDPFLLMAALSVTVGCMDSPDYPAERLESTLQMLWSWHLTLGQGRVLNPMLLMQLSPRLDALVARIVELRKGSSNEDHVRRWTGEIRAAVQTMRESMLPPKSAEGK